MTIVSSRRWRLAVGIVVVLGSLALPGGHAAGAGHPRRLTLWLDESAEWTLPAGCGSGGRVV